MPDQNGSASEITRFAGVRVLVAEASEASRWLLRQQLERLGLAVDTVGDEAAILQALATRDYQLLIGDSQLLEVDEARLVCRIRNDEAQNPARERLPILALASESLETRKGSAAHKIDRIETKPVNLNRMAAVLQSLLQREANNPDSVPPSKAKADFDPAMYCELFEGEGLDGKEWLDGYRQAATAMLDEIVACARRGDRAALATTAHRLAGAALSVGAEPCGLLCRALEKAAPTASDPELQEIIARTGVAVRLADAAIARFISRPQERVA